MHRFIKLFGPELSVPNQPAAAGKAGRALDPKQLPEESSFAFILNELAEHATLPALFGGPQGMTAPAAAVDYGSEKHLTAKGADKKVDGEDKRPSVKLHGRAFTPGLRNSRLQTSEALTPSGPLRPDASQAQRLSLQRVATTESPRLQNNRFQPAESTTGKNARTPADQRMQAERSGRQAEFAVQQDQALLKTGTQPAVMTATTEHTLTAKQAAMEQSAHLLSTTSSSPQSPGLAFTQPFASAPTSSAPLQVDIPMHLSHPQWGEKVGQSLVQFSQQAGTGTHSAQLRLDPPHLGPIQISLHIVDEGLVNAQFYSPHAQVRHSIEQALPQLLEQFNQAGLSLGQTHVGSEQQGHAPTEGFGQFAQSPGGSSEAAAEGAAHEAADAQSRSITHYSNHIIDTFA